MSIELPDLVQRIRVKTNEVKAAEKSAGGLGDRLDVLRQQSADTSDQMDELTGSTDRYGESTRRASKDTDGMTRAFAALRKSSDDAGTSLSGVGDGVERVRAATGGVATDVRDLGAASDDAAGSVDNLGSASTRASRDQDVLRRTTRKTNTEMSSFIKKVLGAAAVLKLLRFGALAVGIDAIAGGIAQLGSLLISGAAGAAALAAALAPVTGLLAGIPAGILAIKSTTFVFSQLTSGVSDAVKAINTYGPGSKEAAQAVKTLSGRNRELAETYAQLRFSFNDILQSGKRAFMPEAINALDRLRGLLPVVGDAFGGLSEVIGGLVARGARLVTSGPFSRDIGTILERNNKLVFTLGRAGLRLVDVLRNIMVAAGPMVQLFADLALKGAKWLSNLVEAGRQTGKLQSFFHDTFTTVRQLINTVIDFGAGLFNILKGGTDLGQDLLDTLRKNAKQFLSWTNSIKGKNRIAQFFDDARRPLAQFGKLATAVGEAFFKIGRKVPTGGLLKQLRTDLLPVLTSLLTKMGRSGLTSAVIELAVAFGKILKNLPVNAIAQLVVAVADLASAFVKLGKAHPVIFEIVGALLAMRVAMKAVSAVSRFTGITALTAAFRDIGPAGTAGARGIKGFVQGLRGAEGATVGFSNKIGLALKSGIGKGVNGVKRLLGKDLDGVINRSLGRNAGIGAKAKKIGTSITGGFTKGVKGIGKAASNASGSIVRALGQNGAIGKRAISLGTSIKSGLGKGLSGTGSVAAKALNGVKTGLIAVGSGAQKAIVGMAGYARTAALAAASAARTTVIFLAQKAAFVAGLAVQGAIRAATLAWTAAQWLLNAALTANPIGIVVVAIGALVAGLIFAWKNSETFRNIVTGAFEAIKKVVSTVVGFIVNFVKNNWKTILTLMTGPIGIAVRIIAANWDRIKTVFRVAVTVIKAVLSKAFSIYRAIFVNTFNGIKKVVSVAWAVIRTVFSTYVKAIVTVVQTGLRLIHDYIVQPLQIAVAVAKAIWARIVDVFKSGVARAIEIVVGIKDRILGFFSGAGEWLYNIGRAVVQGFINGVKAMFGPVADTFGWITDHIPSWKGPIGKDETLLYGAGRAVMSGFQKGIREGIPAVRDTLEGFTRTIGRTKIRVGDGSFVPPSFFPGSPIDSASSIGSAIAAALSKFAPSPKQEKLQQSTVAKQAQQRLQRQAQQAAEQENRIRTRLPLLTGQQKKDARARIRELQAEQDKLTRQAGQVRRVADLRQQRQAAIRNADQLAKQARNLRTQLPQLEGADRRRALDKIAKLDDQRKDELQKAKDVQTQLIKVFRDLPAGVRKLLREAEHERDQKERRQERKDRQDKRGGRGTGGSGDGSGRSKLVPGFGGPDGSTTKQQAFAKIAKGGTVSISSGKLSKHPPLKSPSGAKIVQLWEDYSARYADGTSWDPEKKKFESPNGKMIGGARASTSTQRVGQRTFGESKKGDGGSGVGGGGFGPAGTSSDPVYASLTPDPPPPEKHYQGDKGQRNAAQRVAERIAKATNRATAATDKTGKNVGKLLGKTVTKRDAAKISDKNAREVGHDVVRSGRSQNAQSVKSAKVFSNAVQAAQRDTQKAARDARADAREQRQNLRDLKTQNRTDSKAQRVQYGNVAVNDRKVVRHEGVSLRKKYETLSSHLEGANRSNTIEMLVALRSIQAAIDNRQLAPPPGGNRNPHPPGGGGGGGGGGTHKESAGVTKNYHFHKGSVVNTGKEATEQGIVQRLRMADVEGRPV